MSWVLYKLVTSLQVVSGTVVLGTLSIIWLSVHNSITKIMCELTFELNLLDFDGLDFHNSNDFILLNFHGFGFHCLPLVSRSVTHLRLRSIPLLLQTNFPINFVIKNR